MLKIFGLAAIENVETSENAEISCSIFDELFGE
jgi:hypothetical protein